MAIAYAARFAERVSNLVIWDGFSASKLLPQSSSLETMERLIDQNWPLWVELLVQSIFAWKSPEATMYAKALAESVPSSAALAFLTAAWDWNVTELLAQVERPTLVVHRRDQAFFPLRLGQALAAGIKGARLAIVDGASSLPWVGDSEGCAQIIDDFLGATGAPLRAPSLPSSPSRILATVLFTDIVGSTEKVAEIGDRNWRRLLDAHHEVTRRELARFGGHEVDSAGDGFLATFDRPEQAIRCATSIGQAVKELGLHVRAGVHTGELETDGRSVRGIAVHIGARVAALAGPDEVLTTRTVTDLVAGSGIRFVERGEHSLKGVPGRWALLAAVGQI